MATPGIDLDLRVYTNASQVARVFQREVKSISKKEGRAVANQALRRLRAVAPRNMDPDNPSPFRAQYGQLHRRLRVRVMRVSANYAAVGWMWRYRIWHGDAFWLHFLVSGTKPRFTKKGAYRGRIIGRNWFGPVVATHARGLQRALEISAKRAWKIATAIGKMERIV